jgi:hypothetical protein
MAAEYPVIAVEAIEGVTEGSIQQSICPDQPVFGISVIRE